MATKKAKKPAPKSAKSKGKNAAAKARKAAPAARRRKVLKASPTIKAAAERSAKRAAKGAPIKRKAGIAKPPAARKAANRYVLHGIFASLPSCKVGLMLSMCGVPFDYHHVDLRAGAHKTPEFLAKNRYGQVPVLEHAGHEIAQSNVILDYLARTTGRFAGHSEAERLRVAEWLMWEQDRLASGLGITRFMTRFAPDTHEAVKNFVRARGEAALDTLERHLGTAKFLAGAAPTIADIAVFPWIATAEEGGFDIARWPNVQAWAQRLLALPGVAHPYALMPKENRIAEGK